MSYKTIATKSRKLLNTFLVVALIGAAFASGRGFDINSSNEEIDIADLFTAHTAQGAAVDYFLKLEGIDGESTDDRHKGEIDVMSFGWSQDKPGIQQQIVATGVAAGRASFFDVFVEKMVDKASPKLMLASASGEHIKKATLFARKAGDKQSDFLIITFSDVLISSYQVGGSNSGAPTEHISLNFSKIEFEYKPQKPDGTLGSPVKAGWDLKANKKI